MRVSVQTGEMGSQYDDYWAGQMPGIRAQLHLAAGGMIATVNVPGLTRLGARQSWSGRAEVCGRTLIRSSRAHATSLGKMAAASGICTPWPEHAFRFMIAVGGDLLTIAAKPDRRETREAPGPAGLPRPAHPRTWPQRVRQSQSGKPERLSIAGGSRARDLVEFYQILERLTARQGGLRSLRDCAGGPGCPPQGVYFFYEDGENRADGGRRVVRVGTHALTATSNATLWGRLRQHRGQLGGSNPGGGNHRASVFRRHVGAALIRRDGMPDDLLRSWLDRHRLPVDRDRQEKDIERKVSQHIRVMPFLWLSVPSRTDRGYLESSSIALLSCLAGGTDLPSPGWLGHYSERPGIRESGLWNIHHVAGDYQPGFLQQLRHLATCQA